MKDLKEIYKNEIEKFRIDGHKFLNKELSVAEFKGISGGMGVYAQKGGDRFMIRLRIESGVIDMAQLKLISEYAEKYGLDRIHLTTRQAIQLHNLGIDDVCDIALDSLQKGIYTRGGGGNFPRNVSLSPLAGVDADESFDVTPYALAVNEYFIRRMNTYKLPRKLKVAFSSSKSDTANATVNDLGFIADCDSFKLYIAGGIGRNPSKAVEYDKPVKPEEVLYYVEAMVRFFTAEGDYENKGKARSRFIAQRMTQSELIELFDKHLAEVKRGLKLDVFPANKEVSAKADGTTEVSENVIAQKQDGLYSVVVNPAGGQLMTSDLNKIISFCEDKPELEYRLSMEESLYIRNLTAKQVKELTKITADFSGAIPFTKSLSCIGVPTCQIGIEKSQSLLADIYSYFEDKKDLAVLLPSVHISGCGNSCTRHQVSDIGFGGKKLKDGDGFEVHIKGKHIVGDTYLGEQTGDILFDDVKLFLYDLAVYMRDNNKNFGDTSNDEIKAVFEKYAK